MNSCKAFWQELIGVRKQPHFVPVQRRIQNPVKDGAFCENHQWLNNKANKDSDVTCVDVVIVFLF